MPISSTLKAANQRMCSANKPVFFKGAVIVAGKNRKGYDTLFVDLLFDEPKHIRLFDPLPSIRDRSIQATRLTFLCDSLGGDFKDIPACPGGWEQFAQSLCDYLNTLGGNLFMKLTLNEAGWPELGTDRCFSSKPDMEYSQEDTRFLDESPVDDNTNLPF